MVWDIKPIKKRQIWQKQHSWKLTADLAGNLLLSWFFSFFFLMKHSRQTIGCLMKLFFFYFRTKLTIGWFLFLKFVLGIQEHTMDSEWSNKKAKIFRIFSPLLFSEKILWIFWYNDMTVMVLISLFYKFDQECLVFDISRIL